MKQQQHYTHCGAGKKAAQRQHCKQQCGTDRTLAVAERHMTMQQLDVLLHQRFSLRAAQQMEGAFWLWQGKQKAGDIGSLLRRPKKLLRKLHKYELKGASQPAHRPAKLHLSSVLKVLQLPEIKRLVGSSQEREQLLQLLRDARSQFSAANGVGKKPQAAATAPATEQPAAATTAIAAAASATAKSDLHATVAATANTGGLTAGHQRMHSEQGAKRAASQEQHQQQAGPPPKKKRRLDTAKPNNTSSISSSQQPQQQLHTAASDEPPLNAEGVHKIMISAYGSGIKVGKCIGIYRLWSKVCGDVDDLRSLLPRFKELVQHLISPDLTGRPAYAAGTIKEYMYAVRHLLAPAELQQQLKKQQVATVLQQAREVLDRHPGRDEATRSVAAYRGAIAGKKRLESAAAKAKAPQLVSPPSSVSMPESRRGLAASVERCLADGKSSAAAPDVEQISGSDTAVLAAEGQDHQLLPCTPPAAAAAAAADAVKKASPSVSKGLQQQQQQKQKRLRTQQQHTQQQVSSPHEQQKQQVTFAHFKTLLDAKFPGEGPTYSDCKTCLTEMQQLFKTETFAKAMSGFDEFADKLEQKHDPRIAAACCRVMLQLCKIPEVQQLLGSGAAEVILKVKKTRKRLKKMARAAAAAGCGHACQAEKEPVPGNAAGVDAAAAAIVKGGRTAAGILAASPSHVMAHISTMLQQLAEGLQLDSTDIRQQTERYDYLVVTLHESLKGLQCDTQLQAAAAVLSWLLLLPSGSCRELMIDMLRTSEDWLDKLLLCWSAEVQLTGCAVQQAEAAAQHKYADKFCGHDVPNNSTSSSSSSSSNGRCIKGYLAGLCQLMLNVLGELCKAYCDGDTVTAATETAALKVAPEDLLLGTCHVVLNDKSQQQGNCTAAGHWRSCLMLCWRQCTADNSGDRSSQVQQRLQRVLQQHVMG